MIDIIITWMLIALGLAASFFVAYVLYNVILKPLRKDATPKEKKQKPVKASKASKAEPKKQATSDDDDEIKMVNLEKRSDLF